MRKGGIYEQIYFEENGKAGHAAFPENSRNAIVLVAKAVSESGLTKLTDLNGIEKLEKYFESFYGAGLDIELEDEASGKLTLNIGVIQLAGRELTGLIDIRHPVSFQGEDIVEKIHLKLDEGSRLENVEISAPFYVDPKSDNVKALMEIYRSVTGNAQKPFSMGGGTYSRVVPNAITFGPGLPVRRKADYLPDGHGGAHGPDEALYIEDWLKAFRIYVLSVERLAGERSV